MPPSVPRASAGGSRAHGGFADQIVDLGAEVLEHEILPGRRQVLVDLLRPALQWELDRERLVDCECDVEEVEAVT